ncbi:MAG: hypothetical protein ACI8QZ_002066 [Chlamydiales bacterium]|jgi:hypothetical protein
MILSSVVCVWFAIGGVVSVAGRATAVETGFGLGFCRVPDCNGDGVDEIAVTDRGNQRVLVLCPKRGDMITEIRGLEGIWDGRGLVGTIAIGPSVLGLVVREPGADYQVLSLPDGSSSGALDGGDGFIEGLAISDRDDLKHVFLSRSVEVDPHDVKGLERYTFRLLSSVSSEPLSEYVVETLHAGAACVAGDLNDDGWTDFVVAHQGSAIASEGGDPVSRIELVAVSGAMGAVLYKVRLPGGRPRSIVEVSVTGDVDGDGVVDLLLLTCERSGRTVLALSGADGALVKRIQVEGATGVHVVGDVDGDQCNDLAFTNAHMPIGERNVVDLHSSRSGDWIYRIESPGAPEGDIFDLDSFGCEVCRVNDIDGDGVDDLVIGANSITTCCSDWLASFSGRTGKLIKQLRARDYVGVRNTESGPLSPRAPRRGSSEGPHDR